MRRSLLVFGLLVAGAVMATAGVTGAEYRQRREALRERLGDGIVILTGTTQPEYGDFRSPFFQEPNFYYLTGWTEPGAILVITPDTETLFIPRRDERRERWTGKTSGPSDKQVRHRTHISDVRPAETFESTLPEIADDAAAIYTLLDEPDAAKIQALLPLREFSDAGPAIARLRMMKSEAELELIRRTTAVTIDAHRAAWASMRPGLHEYQVAAQMSYVYFSAGCARHAYAPIVGAGPNSTVLHYNRVSDRIDPGEVVLMDVGAECSYYATDITRTVPANGHFTDRQREIYDIVLGAQQAVLAAVKPGATLSRSGSNSLYNTACEYFDRYQDAAGEGMCRYFTHGIGHHVGLDVHDANDPAVPLEAGMVITVEPGLYLPDEGIGVRIEDMVLVTKDGAEVLSDDLPKDPETIEKLIGEELGGRADRPAASPSARLLEDELQSQKRINRSAAGQLARPPSALGDPQPLATEIP